MVEAQLHLHAWFALQHPHAVAPTRERAWVVVTRKRATVSDQVRATSLKQQQQQQLVNDRE